MLNFILTSFIFDFIILWHIFSYFNFIINYFLHSLSSWIHINKHLIAHVHILARIQILLCLLTNISKLICSYWVDFNQWSLSRNMSVNLAAQNSNLKRDLCILQILWGNKLSLVLSLFSRSKNFLILGREFAANKQGS